MTDPKLVREIKKYNIMVDMPVRGKGSRFGGHERRCLWEICGKPMVQWALEVPLGSKYVNKVVLCSEDREIVKFGEKMDGVTIIPRTLDEVLQVPRDWHRGVFQRQRPRSLFSGDFFPAGVDNFDLYSTDPYRNPRAYSHWYLQEYESYVADIDIGITANEPMSTTETLDRLIEAFFLDEEANCAKTFYPILPYIFTINPKTKRPFPLFHWSALDRQMYPPIYRTGPFCLSGCPLKSMYGSSFKIAHIIIDPEEALDIHDEEDLFLANCYMKRRLSRQEPKKRG